jgi:ABC-type multidrug transport system ATPase subunit
VKIILTNVAKKYHKEWIFKNLNYEITPNKPLGIVGNNGSGKSTLLQLIASLTYPTQGNIKYYLNNKTINEDKLYLLSSFAAPYQELLEELTLIEHVKFHLKFKSFRNNLSVNQFIELINLSLHQNKPVYNFSSGMKQRLKLGLAILSDTPFLFLDEPTSNLDNDGIAWFKNILSNHLTHRITLISSNHHPDELFCCTQFIDVREYKTN